MIIQEIIFGFLFVASSGLFFSERFRKNKWLLGAAGLIAIVSTYFLTAEIVNRIVDQRMAQATAQSQPTGASAASEAAPPVPITEQPATVAPTPATEKPKSDIVSAATPPEVLDQTVGTWTANFQCHGRPFHGYVLQLRLSNNGRVASLTKNGARDQEGFENYAVVLRADRGVTVEKPTLLFKEAAIVFTFSEDYRTYSGAIVTKTCLSTQINGTRVS